MVLDLKKVLKQFTEKYSYTQVFGKAIFRVLHCHFLVNTAPQMKFMKYLLPETRGGINEQVTEQTTDQM